MSGYLQLSNKQNFQSEFFSTEDNEPLKELGNISDINIFIGANNSRKSRFMRELLKEATYTQSSDRVLHLIKKASGALKTVLSEAKKHSSGTIISISINISPDHAERFKGREGWDKFIQFAQSNNSRSININDDYFNKLYSYESGFPDFRGLPNSSHSSRNGERGMQDLKLESE